MALDRGPKLRTYERHGVLEYLIWRVDDSLFEWYILRDNGFELLPPSVDGIFRSETFPGLWLNASAMMNRDGATVITTLNDGLTHPDHAEFIKKLQQKRDRR